MSGGENGETHGAEKSSAIRTGVVEAEEALATMRKTLEEHEAALSRKCLECSKLRAESARYSEEFQDFKRREAVIRNDLKAAKKTLHETELQNQKLKGVLETVRQEKGSNASTAAQLRQDTRIREKNTEQIHVTTAEGRDARVHDGEAEVQKLKTYLAGVQKSRCVFDKGL